MVIGKNDRCFFACEATQLARCGATDNEKVVYPRWPAPFEPTKRLVGAVVLILSASLVFVPIPLSNVIPAPVIALISLAYLEEDGLMLLIALLGRSS